MASPSAGRPSRTPTHYQVLDLQPALLAAAAAPDAAALVKRAYRRALLRNHPDKATATTAAPFTVDQVGAAYAVLSSPRRRQEYDAALRTGDDDDEQAPSSTTTTRFRTGIENVDLDDLGFDEVALRWHRSCRCGNDRGYAFDEADLVEASDDGVLMVGCQDCSLWLKVHFAMVDE